MARRVWGETVAGPVFGGKPRFQHRPARGMCLWGMRVTAHTAGDDMGHGLFFSRFARWPEYMVTC